MSEEQKKPSQETGGSSPYLKLGWFLRKTQLACKISDEQMANLLGISRAAWNKIVYGQVLPDHKTTRKLSEILGIELAKLVQTVSYYAHKARTSKETLEENPLKGALAYSKQYDDSIEQVEKTYAAASGKPSLSDGQKKLLMTLKKDLSKAFYLPILPVDFMLYLDALEQNKNKANYLHEVNDFMIKGESLSGAMARNIPMAAFIGFAANVFCFEDSPSKNVIDAMNRLTVRSGAELILMATTKRGIYTLERELPYLTQHTETISHEALLCRELERHWPDNIDFNHLYNACVLQLGKYAIYTQLQPSLQTQAGETISDEEEIYSGLDNILFRTILKEMNAVASASIAANWGYAQEVQDILIGQTQPSQNASPLCAAFQMIKRFINDDFAGLSKKQVDEVLADYPQVSISSDVLMKVFVQLQNKIEEQIEKSTSTISKISVKAANYASKKNETMKQKMADLSLFLDYHNPNSTDYRFDEEYLKSATVDALSVLNKQKNEFLLAGKTETLDDVQQRIGNFNLRTHFLLHRNFEVLFDRFKVSKEQAKERLKLK